MKFLGCVSGSEPFDYGAYVDHDPDPGFFCTEFLPLRVRRNDKNFMGSAGSVEVCTV